MDISGVLEKIFEASPYIPIVVAWAPLLMGYIGYIEEYVNRKITESGKAVPTEVWSMVKRSALIGICIGSSYFLGCRGTELWAVSGISAGIASGGYAIKKNKDKKAKVDLAKSNIDGIPS